MRIKSYDDVRKFFNYYFYKCDSTMNVKCNGHLVIISKMGSTESGIVYVTLKKHESEQMNGAVEVSKYANAVPIDASFLRSYSERKRIAYEIVYNNRRYINAVLNPVGEVAGDKKKFIESKLSKVLREVDGDIESVRYVVQDEEEYVVIRYRSGYRKRVCITADSKLGIIKDVVRKLE